MTFDLVAFANALGATMLRVQVGDAPISECCEEQGTFHHCRPFDSVAVFRCPNCDRLFTEPEDVDPHEHSIEREIAEARGRDDHESRRDYP